MVELLAKVGSYAVGDVWALVPARKAVWSLPGKPKAIGNNFFLPIFLSFILTLLPVFAFSTYTFSDLFYISYITIYSSV